MTMMSVLNAYSARPSGGMGTRRPTAPLAEFYMAKGRFLRPKARSALLLGVGRVGA